ALSDLTLRRSTPSRRRMPTALCCEPEAPVRRACGVLAGVGHGWPTLGESAHGWADRTGRQAPRTRAALPGADAPSDPGRGAPLSRPGGEHREGRLGGDLPGCAAGAAFALRGQAGVRRRAADPEQLRAFLAGLRQQRIR